MKIITNDFCYINTIDVANLQFYKYEVPEEIYQEAFPHKKPIVTEYNEYNFIEVDMNKYSGFVKTVRNTDWIMDFKELNNAHSRELLELLKGLIIRRSMIIRTFNEMEYSEKRKNRKMKERCDVLDMEIKTVKDFLCYRLGYVKLDVPDKAKERIKQKSKLKTISNTILRKQGL